jgi:cytidyltransferase-like protein
VPLVEGRLLPETLPEVPGLRPDIWVVGDCRANAAQAAHARARGIAYHVLEQSSASPTFPVPPPRPSVLGRKKVVVTGCYDWFHSGHVRFFEEVSAHGDLYVVVGHDANIRLLKGEGHPLFPQDERRYLVGSVRFVTAALISSGNGWLDAEPEIHQIQPDIYAVNEDGDKGGKREFCERHGIQYLVLKRTPAPGLPRRSSTNLRGF